MSSRSEALGSGEGYDEGDIVDIVVEKTSRYREQLKGGVPVSSPRSLQNLFALSVAAGGSPVDVVDIGGACAAGYFEACAWLPGLVRRWCVVERPLMASRASEHFQQDGLAFYPELTAALEGIESPSIAIFGGSLHYLESPFDMVEAARSSMSFLYVTRTPFLMEGDNPIYLRQTTRLLDHGPSRPTLGQKDRAVALPVTVLPYASALRRFEDPRNLVMEFDEGESFTIGGKTVAYRGFLVRVGR